MGNDGLQNAKAARRIQDMNYIAIGQSAAARQTLTGS